MKKTQLLCFLSMILLLISCNQKKEMNYKLPAGFPYNLNFPDKKYKLPAILEEISGLSYINSNQLACIQDEDGILFIYDLDKERIVRKFKFAIRGDFEGVEVVGEKVYVAKSNGNIYSFTLSSEGQDTEIHDTPLKSRNNVEGLGYDVKSNSLLIACKEKGNLENTRKRGKAVYRLLLSNRKFIEEPYIEIQEKNKKLKPSAIGVSPITGEAYLLSSSHELLVFENQELKTSISLNPSIFEKPEGIAFSPDGTLYISSEGNYGKGYILKFNLRK